MSKRTGQAGEVERRFLPLEAAELRLAPAEAEGEPERIRGWFAIHERWSPVYGDFRERIARGFFRPALEALADVRALWNHNPDFVLGRTRSGTLRLEEREDGDVSGLWGEINPPAAGVLRELALEPMRRGDVTGASFAFTVAEDAWEEGEGGIWQRTLVRIGELLEVSPVTFPFYPETALALRSREAWRAGHQAPEAEPGGPDAGRKLRQLRAELEVAAE